MMPTTTAPLGLDPPITPTEPPQASNHPKAWAQVQLHTQHHQIASAGVALPRSTHPKPKHMTKSVAAPADFDLALDEHNISIGTRSRTVSA